MRLGCNHSVIRIQIVKGPTVRLTNQIGYGETGDRARLMLNVP
nr:MAG TPA: hypothetical protein [Caudoviricetes sp.]DAR38627.1 MAG TPA: hypothetical protein [Caudoviricetes sp.]